MSTPMVEFCIPLFSTKSLGDIYYVLELYRICAVFLPRVRSMNSTGISAGQKIPVACLRKFHLFVSCFCVDNAL